MQNAHEAGPGLHVAFCILHIVTGLTRSSRIRVRYAETDQMGVVYYANYFVWFEVGRTDRLRDAGWTYRQLEQDGVSLPVIEAHAEYAGRPATTMSSRSGRRQRC